MHPRRVAITGMGIICALGRSVEEFGAALIAGRPAIGPLECVDRSRLRFQNAAEVRGYRMEEYFDDTSLMLLDRFAQFGMIAAREAVAMAGIEWTQELGDRTAIVTGSAMGGQTTEDQAFVDLYQLKKTRMNPLSIPRVMSNAAASQISMRYGIHGPAYTISTACSSANHAIGQAFRMVRCGQVDLALAGGSEAPMSLGNLKAWEAMRVVSPDTCRPFSKDRSGIILGEGGAILVLEPMERAKQRGAAIVGEIVGFGMSSDAHHITNPSVEGAARALRAALLDAELEASTIGYINAHGTATQMNDAMEVAAVRAVFGNQAEKLSMSSTKSMHGHALGAAGAIEAVATVLALRDGMLPPTANFRERDPECDLDVIPNEARVSACEYALSNSFAFGGLNAVVVFRRPIH